MARQPYPLEALRKLRDERAEAQALTLAKQVARVAAAEAQLVERERQTLEHQERTREVRLAERERLAAGGVSGADLQRSVEFEAGARLHTEQLRRAEDDARQALAKERAQEQQLREELSQRDAEAKLARNHEASFHERNASAALRSEEDAALEQWNARHR
jgi:hypothetical protein